MTTWIKLHDNFWENPKVLAAGEDAALLYIQGLSYCSRNLTDGAIPTPALRNLTAKRDAKTLARILVREGLWIETATGWQVHDYLKVQRSRSQVEDEREKSRERKARSRAGHAVTPPVTDAVSHADVTPPETETDTETDPPLPPSKRDLIVDAVFDRVLRDKQAKGDHIFSVDGFRRWWDENELEGCQKRIDWFLEHYMIPTIGQYADAVRAPSVPQWASPYLRREESA